MAIASPSALLDWLKGNQFLQPFQADEVAPLLPTFADCHALAKELIRRDWLTPYQVNQILTGKEDQLILGSYRIRERIGEGAMGQVFKAWSVRLERLVALKTVHKELVHPKAMNRFRREMETASRLDHPNIALVRDADEADGRPYLVLDFIDGFDLAKRVKQGGPLPIAEAVEYARQTALGLQHAFERGVVHRDIKPANLLVTARSNGEAGPLVKILDFGLARYESEREGSMRLTQIGSMLGTIDYVAPEQAQNAQSADIRADIYSLGCTLFYLLAGRPPFAGTSVVEKLGPRVTGDPPGIREARSEVDPALEAIILKMMARRPDDRYQTPIDVAQALQPFAAASSGVVMAMPVAAGSSGPVPMALPVGPPPSSSDGAFTGMSESGRDISDANAAAVSPNRASKSSVSPMMIVGGVGFLMASLLCLGVCLVGYSYLGKNGKSEGAIKIIDHRYSMFDKKALPGQPHQLIVTIERVSFNGPVRLSLKDLPDGVKMTGKSNEIPTGAYKGTVGFIVSYGTDPMVAQITLRADWGESGFAEKRLDFEVAPDPKGKGKK